MNLFLSEKNKLNKWNIFLVSNTEKRMIFLNIKEKQGFFYLDGDWSAYKSSISFVYFCPFQNLSH